jgi:hypothetical protein
MSRRVHVAVEVIVVARSLQWACHRAAVLSGWGHRRRSGLSTGLSSLRSCHPSNCCQDRGRHADVVVAVGAIACLSSPLSGLSSSRRHHVAVVQVVAVGVRVVVCLSLAASGLWSSRHRRGRHYHRRLAVFVVAVVVAAPSFHSSRL